MDNLLENSFLEEILKGSSPHEEFYVHVNKLHKYAKVHRGDCGSCNRGTGQERNGWEPSGKITKYLGPYANFSMAWRIAQNTKMRDITRCKACNPH
jgi:hypothetical protein